MARSAKPWFYAQKNTWYVRVEGRKVSLGVHGKENRQDARAAWHRLMHEGRTKPETKKETPTVAEVVKAFLEDAKGRLKPATVRWYSTFLAPFSDAYGKVKANALTAKQAEAFASNPTWSNSTRNGFLTALSVAFRWARYPILGLRKPPKESRGAKALVGEEDHALLLDASPANFKPFLRLLHLTGARPAEVASITSDNFDEANGLVVLDVHKTARYGKSRILVLCPEAVAILKEQKERYGEGHLLRNRFGLPWTMDGVAHLMAALRKRTGAKGTAYGYRHTFATDALASGVPDAQVAALLGHSGTAMLHRHYSHLTSRTQVLREALGRVR
jgi:integrase